MKPLFAIAAIFALCVKPIMAKELDRNVLKTDTRTNLEITIFEGDLAMVTDTRRMPVKVGDQEIVFDDVARGLRPETVMISGADLTVTQQVFDNNLLTLSQLAKAYEGQAAGLKRKNSQDGSVVVDPVTIIAVNSDVIVERAGRIEAVNVQDLVFEKLPDGLPINPSLSAIIKSSSDEGTATVQLRYLTSGLSWSTNYVADISADEASVALVAWASLHNQDGASFPKAMVTLMAGDLNVVRPEPRAQVMSSPAMVAADASVAPEIQHQGISGYHAYQLPRPVTLLPGQSRQVALMTAPTVKIVTEHIIRGPQHPLRGRHSGKISGQATRAVRFTNDEQAGLGLALPAGVVRFYQGGTFIGEDNLKRLGQGAEATLILGRDFDVTYERQQTDYQKISDRIHETTHEVRVINGSDAVKTVKVIDILPGDWEIIDETQPHEKLSSSEASWTLSIPEGSDATVSYRVRVRF